MTLDLEKGKIRSWPLDLGLGKVKRHFGEVKGHFQIYKRMHWVVCKTQERRLRENFRVGLREEK
jgi:hypothetical protein